MRTRIRMIATSSAAQAVKTTIDVLLVLLGKGEQT
jgi:hypothetical protein